MDSQLLLQKMFCHVEKGFPISDGTLADIAYIICPEIMSCLYRLSNKK